MHFSSLSRHITPLPASPYLSQPPLSCSEACFNYLLLLYVKGKWVRFSSWLQNWASCPTAVWPFSNPSGTAPRHNDIACLEKSHPPGSCISGGPFPQSHDVLTNWWKEVLVAYTQPDSYSPEHPKHCQTIPQKQELRFTPRPVLGSHKQRLSTPDETVPLHYFKSLMIGNSKS